MPGSIQVCSQDAFFVLCAADDSFRRAMAEMETDDEGEGEGDAGDGEEPEEVAAEEEV